MEEQIQEIQDYFIDKILANDFVVTRVKKYTLSLMIDNKYEFTIWTANNAVDRQLYSDSLETNFMQFTFSELQAIECSKILERHITKWKEEVEMVQNRKLFEKLKIELGEE